MSDKRTDDEKAEVELTIQIGAEMEDDVLSILTHARKVARKLMMMDPEEAELIHEEKWCSGAMRVTLRRPFVGSAPPAK